MGDRAQVRIVDNYQPEAPGVYLYTHWGGTRLLHDVLRALSKQRRWDDPTYLARIVLNEIQGERPPEEDTIQRDYWDECGCGIDQAEHCDIEHPLITLIPGSEPIIRVGENEWSFLDAIRHPSELHKEYSPEENS